MRASSQISTEVGQLLVRLEQGDAAAKNLLIERCREQFRRRARQMLGDFPKLRPDVDTSEVEQELNLRLCTALDEVKLNDARHLLRLASLIIRRLLVDLARKHRLLADLKEREHEPVDPGHGPAGKAILAEIHRWVGTLPQEQQEVFDLVFYQELSQEEAARVMNTSRKVVMRLVRELKLECMRKFGDEMK
jgi:RNA polymerase sigma factor (sigma-70 family)